MTKSCKDCPSFLSGSQQLFDKYGRNPGAAVCMRFGYVLENPANPASVNDALQEHKAESCPGFGQPQPPEPNRNLQVFLPDPSLRELDKIDEDKKIACTSCAQCSNLVREQVVANKSGFTAGVCAAKGKLILSNRLGWEAKQCDFRQVGPQRATLGGLSFIPELERGFLSGSVGSTTQSIIAGATNFVEPNEYPTDKEVSEGEKTAGIRAWRKVEDPEGYGKPVYVPVYDPDFFEDDERALIPKTGSDEHPELYVDHFGGVYGLAVAWMELDETPVFWGMPGTGKTELLRHMAWLMSIPFRRISVTSSTEIDDIAGKMEYDPARGTHFKYGRLPDAWSKPGIICLDEPNVAQDPAVWHFIRPLTDNSKQLVMDMNEGEPLDRHPDCYLGLAMNPAWDVRNVGALEIADADANRLFHTYIDLPPEPIEREIIQARVRLDGWELSYEQLDMVMGIARDLRGLSDEKVLPITWAIRQQIKVARALKWFSPPVAYRRAAGDYLEPEALETLLDQVKTHWKQG